MGSYFGVADYIIFAISLLFSIVVGLRFGCFGTKQKSAQEYLYGKRNLKAIPVGLSIYSSMVSTVSIIGLPSEVYTFGTQFVMICIGNLISMFLVWLLILPVFNGTLDIKSPYEYYELRFNKSVRYVSTVFYILLGILILPLILFTSCLAFSEATGININICTTLAGSICIFYTLLGGFSTVVWTDAFQATLMIATCICMMVLGVARSGGLQEIWTKAEDGHRINFINWNPNPFQRLNIWAVTIGMGFNFAAHMGSSACSLQRYMSLRTENDAKISIAVGNFGYIIITLIGCVTGLSMYAFYQGCDPVQNNEVGGYNQLTAYFVLDTMKNITGLSGLFSAGVLNAGLSSFSAEANTLSGIIYYDFIQNNFPKYSSDKKGAMVMKFIVLIIGVYTISVAPVMAKVKYLIQMIISVSSTINGAKLSLLILGTTFPKATARGALCGVFTGVVFISWTAIGATYYDVASLYQLPVSVENCPQINTTDILLNSTLASINYTIPGTTKEEPFFMYKLSFLLYTFFSVILSVSVALIVSYLTGVNDVETIDPRLLIRYVRPKKIINNSAEMQKMLFK